MTERGPILVPLDGSELAEGALPMATALARAERTHLVLLSVWEPPGSGLAPVVSLELEERARDYFQTYLGGVRDRLQDKQIRNIVLCGDACDETLATAEQVGARTIVMASHGRSGVGRWLYGSTASRLLHESRIPVLVVGPAALETTERPAIKHVMVPLDGSPLAEVAIATGVQLASAFDAKLSLVQAIRWAYEAYPYAGASGYVQSLDSELEASACSYIQRQESAIAGQVDVHGFVVHGTAADTLMAFEAEREVDLVVMTTHARTGIGRATLGSTAERMLQGKAPVLLLRPEREAPKSEQADEVHRDAAAVPR